MGTVKLLHRVFEFLASQSAGQLSDLASGRLTLATVSTVSTVEAAGPVATPEPVGAVASPPDRPEPVPVPARSVDYAAVVEALRRQPSAADGTAYLNALTIRGKKATKTDLIAIGAAMELTLPAGTLKAEAIRKLVERALGPQRLYASLNAW